VHDTAICEHLPSGDICGSTQDEGVGSANGGGAWGARAATYTMPLTCIMSHLSRISQASSQRVITAKTASSVRASVLNDVTPAVDSRILRRSGVKTLKQKCRMLTAATGKYKIPNAPFTPSKLCGRSFGIGRGQSSGVEYEPLGGVGVSDIANPQ
jgi:hypothetical protein